MDFVMDVMLGLHGQRTRYVLSDERLSINERVIELATIARVRLATLANMQMCELALRDGTSAMIANDAREDRTGYSAIVKALHERLAGGEVQFVRGSWLLVGVLAAIGVIAVAAAVVLQQGWISVSPGLEGKATWIMILGAIWIVVGPALVWGSRPRPYDPRAVPPSLLA